jgi:hypothetical protein
MFSKWSLLLYSKESVQCHIQNYANPNNISFLYLNFLGWTVRAYLRNCQVRPKCVYFFARGSMNFDGSRFFTESTTLVSRSFSLLVKERRKKETIKYMLQILVSFDEAWRHGRTCCIVVMLMSRPNPIFQLNIIILHHVLIANSYTRRQNLTITFLQLPLKNISFLSFSRFVSRWGQEPHVNEINKKSDS